MLDTAFDRQDNLVRGRDPIPITAKGVSRARAVVHPRFNISAMISPAFISTFPVSLVLNCWNKVYYDMRSLEFSPVSISNGGTKSMTDKCPDMKRPKDEEMRQ
ncbi:MAG: hypothetical protein JKY20_05465 [Alphaproteobacteria bacterium]|nr:hypothetical protein [Alphaproteobacteria bacterium]